MDFEPIYNKLMMKQYIEAYTDLMFCLVENPRDTKVQIMLGMMEEMGSNLSLPFEDFLLPEGQNRGREDLIRLALRSYRKARGKKDIEALYNEFRLRKRLEHKSLNELLFESNVSREVIREFIGDRGAFVDRFRLIYLFQGEPKLAADLPLDAEPLVKMQLANEYLYDIHPSYEENRPKFKPNMEKGMFWLKLAAEGGYPEAMSLLGFHYQMGLGIKKDLVESLKWHRLAAQKEVLESIKELIEYYISQPKDKRDDKELLQWILVGVKKDYPRAYSLAGQFHMTGRGTKKDPLAAIECYRKGLFFHDAESMRGISNHFATEAEKDFRLASYWYLRFLLRKNDPYFSVIF